MAQVAERSNFPALWNQSKKTVQCLRSLAGSRGRILLIPTPVGCPHAHKNNALTSIWINSALYLSLGSPFLTLWDWQTFLSKKPVYVYPDFWGCVAGNCWELVLREKRAALLVWWKKKCLHCSLVFKGEKQGSLRAAEITTAINYGLT